MKLTKRAPTANTWGTVPVGATRVPVRWIVLWLGFAGWLGTTLINTGPKGIIAFSLNTSLLLALVLLSTATRSISLRTVFLMFVAGGVAMGAAVVIEKIFLIPFLAPLRSCLVPVIEEAAKLVPLFVYIYRSRKFTRYTTGITDMLLMGAALGAGFAVVNDAFLHISRNWNHQIQWLPTADLVSGTFLVTGHSVWTAIAATMIGIALLLRHKSKASLIIGFVGLSWAIFDHFACLQYQSSNLFSSSLRMLSANGYASAYIFLVCVFLALAIDTWIKFRWSLKANEFRLPSRGELTNGLPGLWDFLLDKRRLAFANYRRKVLGSDANASMTVAILAQTLINHHIPPKMARVLSAMTDGSSTQIELPDGVADSVILSTDTLDLPDHYQLISRLSVGGMGAIYKARHRNTNAILAIKVLHPHIAKKESNVQRFEREAKAASALKHPNLVVIHDYGLTPNEIPYLVMEMIDGKTLRSEIGTTKGLPPNRFFTIFEQICEALEHAHKKGVIHRDIKPSNILLMKVDDVDDFVKLVDFGIAKVVSANELDEQELTRTGDIVGSPLYMSPEQCVGDLLDIRTDVYSLGCVMYEAITGKPPLTAENAVKTIFKHVNVTPDPISMARPDISLPPSVEQVIFKCLKKSPSDRFASMNEVKSALAGCKSSMSL